MPVPCGEVEARTAGRHQSGDHPLSRSRAEGQSALRGDQPEGWPKRIYQEIYCARGDAENRIKELKYGLEIDRTSCTDFLANQLRVLMTAAAYVLMQELRFRARGTGCARAQVAILRLRLLKIGAWIESSVRRIVLHLPVSTPHAADWCRIARGSVGAVPT